MNFYVVEKPKADSDEDFRGGIDAIKEAGSKKGAAPSCLKCGLALGMLTWLPPYRVELEIWGREYGDVIRLGNDLIVSQRFVRVFQENALTGLSVFEPIEITKFRYRRSRPKEAPPLYFKSTVIRSTTAIDQKASAYEWEDENAVCPECLFDTLKCYQAVVIIESTWTGDDIFFPRGGLDIVVSERFKSCFVSNELRGIEFIPSGQYGYDSCPWESQHDQMNAAGNQAG